MSLLPRHRFILRILNIALRTDKAPLSSFEPFFDTPRSGILSAVNNFFAPEGSKILYFVYLLPDNPHATLLSAIENGTRKNSDVIMAGSRTSGYFVCTCDPGLAWDQRRVRFYKTSGRVTVDPMISTDTTLTYTVVSGAGGCGAFDCASFRSVYLPSLAKAPPFSAPKSLTKISPDNLTENALDFVNAAEDTFDSVLCRPGNVCGSTENAESDEFVSYSPELHVCEAFLRGWCSHVYDYLSKVEEQWEADVTSGPKTEIRHWNRRRLVIAAMEAQLKTRQCQCIISIVSEQAVLANGTHLVPLVNTWEEMRNRLLLSLEEATDVANDLLLIKDGIEALDFPCIEEAADISRFDEILSDLIKGLEVSSFRTISPQAGRVSEKIATNLFK